MPINRRNRRNQSEHTRLIDLICDEINDNKDWHIRTDGISSAEQPKMQYMSVISGTWRATR